MEWIDSEETGMIRGSGVNTQEFSMGKLLGPVTAFG